MSLGKEFNLYILTMHFIAIDSLYKKTTKWKAILPDLVATPNFSFQQHWSWLWKLLFCV